jgi:phosphoribosylaminoimidazole-succinocarboxamide synthase
LLVRFADAVITGSEADVATVRDEIAQTMGGEALTDTAAVAALFNAIDRVADSTGIEMEEAKAEASADFRADIGVNDFYSADQKGR